ncbi:unnamed protein product [Symbiodinium necroappetens]|uniref:Uncharacterized protein n=1 Tax=Symbiodinium necroappetens TaxID=1628268 RepID=A0A812ZGC6_9DINO|nr:unnamed protein product [Symbiodinium necroappetens]
MGHGYKHRETKGELIQWLQRSRDEALWARLTSTAVRDWIGFAQHLKKAWSAAGGDPYDLRFLDNKQHAVHVWQTVSKPARQQKRDPRSTGGPPPSLDDLMNWLWYYENDEFWEKLHTKDWQHFAAILRAEWAKARPGNRHHFPSLRDPSNCRMIYDVMFGKEA